MSEYVYRLVNATVEISKAGSSEVLWSGRPLGRDVLDVVALPGGRGAAVLLDDWGMSPELGTNLVAIDESGTALWHAQLPTSEGDDCFVDLRIDAAGLRPATWSGYRVIISPTDGKLIGKEWVK